MRRVVPLFAEVVQPFTLPPSLTNNLNQLQRKALDAAVSGSNVLLMGAAGTGKSHVSRVIHSARLLAGRSIVSTAPFGVAACNVDGFTIHSTFALGVRDLQLLRELSASNMQDTSEYKEVLRRIAKGSFSKRKALWEQIDTLLIDEISTCDAVLFDLLDFMAKLFKGTEQPFGGIQIIAVGDFLQLPPVEGDWAFKGTAFNEVFKKTDVVQLSEVLRQGKDQEFLEALNFIRTIDLENKNAMALAKRQLIGCCAVGKEPTDCIKLVPLRKMADAWNRKMLESLSGEVRTFDAYDSKVRIDAQTAPSPCSVPNLSSAAAVETERLLSSLLANSRFEACFVLKKGCRVMHLKNLTRGIKASGSSSRESVVNGHTGTVVGFKEPPASDQTHDYLLWAAMRKRDSLPVELPQVRWDHSGSRSFVFPVMTTVGDYYTSKCRVKDRIQLPLSLSWAVTAHKCQGMTIPGKVSVALHRSFAPGQCYVALSRSQSGGNTYISGLEEAYEGFAADREALEFLGYLSSSQAMNV